MNLETAIKEVQKALKNKQDPDTVTFHKQWDERGSLKGWSVSCEWEDAFGDMHGIVFDMTKHYTRVLGDLDTIPNYVPGKHQRV